MQLTEAIVLGVLQGLTEFLPISSSGHLVVTQKLLGLAEHDLAFDIAVHCGTLLAIFTVYRKLVVRVLAGCFRFKDWSLQNTEFRLVALIIIGSVPTAILGLTFKRQFESLFSNDFAVGVGFLVTGVLLLLTKLRGSGLVSAQNLDDLTGIRDLRFWQALLIGVAQGFAIAPAVSRSGTTIVTGLLLGVKSTTAAMYSFMLSVPAIIGAAVLELKDISFSPGANAHLFVGVFSAYLSGVVGLKGIIATVRRGRLDIFSIYTLGLGCLVLWAWA